MSDSDCSNCEKECTFRDYVYNCYVRECRDVKKALSTEQYEILKKVSEFSTEQYETTGIDGFYQIYRAANELVEMFEEDVETCIAEA